MAYDEPVRSQLLCYLTVFVSLRFVPFFCRWDPSIVRMAYDEPVRYKLAQLVGNLSLLSHFGSHCCQWVAAKAYHRTDSQTAFLLALQVGP
jgi:hypothetical protein